MKKKLNELFDQATPRELDGFSDALNAPALSDETLASIKNKVYTKTKLNPEPKRVQKPRTPRMIWLRVGALAACLCLIVTGVFGGVGLLKDHFSDATAPITQHTPDLPLDNYPPNEVDYANMSMVEYMELHPDFLSYRYMPWEEGYAFAHLEVLEIEEGYRQIAYKLTDGTFEYLKDTSGRGTHVRVRCRVVKDYWNKLEAGSEIDLFINSRITIDYKHFNEDYTLDFLKNTKSFLMRLQVAQPYIYGNGKREIVSEVYDSYLGHVGCFPLVDGKISLDGLKDYLGKIKEEPWYDIGVGGKPIFCSFSDVENIVADGMSLDTACENLSAIYDKYQTGEYNHLSIALVSQMNYGEYCRVIEGTLTDEDIDKFGFRLAIEYASMPPLVFTELSLSDGTKFEFCTRAKISEKWMKKLVEEDSPSIELAHTDENGKLNAEACVEEIKKREFGYCWTSVYGIEPNDVN